MALDAVAVARAFEVMLPPHKASLTLQHNDHKNYYKTVKDLVEDDEADDPKTRFYNFVSPIERQKAIETDELWSLQWYPDTPIGSHIKHAASLPALAQWLQDQGLAFGS